MFTTGTRHRSSCLLGDIPGRGRCHQIIPSPYDFVSSASGHTAASVQCSKRCCDFVLETSPRWSVTCHSLFFICNTSPEIPPLPPFVANGLWVLLSHSLQPPTKRKHETGFTEGNLLYLQLRSLLSKTFNTTEQQNKAIAWVAASIFPLAQTEQKNSLYTVPGRFRSNLRSK